MLCVKVFSELNPISPDDNKTTWNGILIFLKFFLHISTYDQAPLQSFGSTILTNSTL